MEAKNRNVPFIVYEAMLEKEDRQQRRMIALLILSIALLVVSNGLWIFHQIRCSCIKTDPPAEEQEEDEEIWDDRESRGEG